MSRQTRIRASDGVTLHVETTGDVKAGAPILYVHEFAGSSRSFDAQVAAFGAQHGCIAFNARGYAPSDVPESEDSYSEERAAGDIADVADALGAGQVHLVGVSMGAASALQYALAHPQRVRSLTLVGIGTGSDGDPAATRAAMEANAAAIERDGMAALAAKMSLSPTRHRLRDKDPAGFERFVAQFAGMSPVGAANTMRGVQKRRASLYTHADRLAALRVPVLVLVGGDDAGCLAPSSFLQATLPHARLVVVPDTGHAVNLEEPARFNLLHLEFIGAAGQ